MARARSQHFLLALGLSFASLACGSGSNPSASATPSNNVPDPGPGNEVDIGFASVPPNDTPDQATPLGTATTGDVTVWVGTNDIGGSSNPANYFVFRSGPTSGQFAFDGCFTAPLTSMTAQLWTVVDAQPQLPPVATWTSTPDGDSGTSCLTDEMVAMEASTVYLFGLTASGGAGSYTL